MKSPQENTCPVVHQVIYLTKRSRPLFCVGRGKPLAYHHALSAALEKDGLKLGIIPNLSKLPLRNLLRHNQIGVASMYDKILELSNLYLSRKIHLEDFQQQFAGFYFEVRKSSKNPSAASRLCSEIVGPLAELTREHRSEESFRQELAAAVRLLEAESIAD